MTSPGLRTSTPPSAASRWISKRSEALEVIHPLVDWADVVVENFSPGTMAKLGLDYDTLARRNPAIVMVSGSVYGQTGPLAQEWGIDGTGAALSARTYLTGWPDRGARHARGRSLWGRHRALRHGGDRECGAAAAAPNGAGAYIDASMYEICVQQMYAAMASASAGGSPGRSGNEDSGVFWQGVFPAQGDDRWVAITVTDEREWRRLMFLAGGPDVGAWTSTLPDHSVVLILQGHGIAAGVVQDIEDLFDDPGIQSRKALVELEHARLGAFGHVRTPIDFSSDSNTPFRAPGLGEHSVEVARGVAGVTPERVEVLQQLGVFT